MAIVSVRVFVVACEVVFFGAWLLAQELAPVKDLPRTIGDASRTRGPLMFCALPDASAIPLAYAAAVKGGRRPFVVGWELQVDPPRELAKTLLITSLPQTGILADANCKRVQSLPTGGAGAMRLHTPYAAVDKATDWAAGYTSLVMTAKNDALPATDYVPRLKRHIELSPSYSSRTAWTATSFISARISNGGICIGSTGRRRRKRLRPREERPGRRTRRRSNTGGARLFKFTPVKFPRATWGNDALVGGAPDKIRTCGLLLRRQTLYPG